MSQLDPVIENDLNAIETALAEGRPTATDPDQRVLQELALLLEADAPEPDPQFAASLGGRVRDAFPRKRRVRVPTLRFGRFHAFAGVAAAGLLAVVVVVSLNGSDENTIGEPLSLDSPATQPAPAGEIGGALQRDAAPLSGTDDSAGSVGAPPIGGGNFAPGKRERRIERSASLTLAAPGDELDRVAERVQAVTDRYGGFVLRSSITSGDEGAEGGSFELRIPASRLQPALRDLAALGEVRSRTQSGQDVTPEFVTAADRLQAARAERRSLLTRLENATTDTEVEALRRKLDLNASEIRALRAQLRDLRIRTDYAVVSLTLVKDGEDSGSGGSGGSGSIDDALDDALNSLADSIGIALRVLGVAIPLTLFGGLAWASVTLWRRRRREAALS